jgi:hypothetical protein
MYSIVLAHFREWAFSFSEPDLLRCCFEQANLEHGA